MPKASGSLRHSVIQYLAELTAALKGPLPLLSLVLHGWTVVLAFKMGGLLAAVLALVIPVIAEVLVAWHVWRSEGVTSYIACLGVYVAAWLLVAMLTGAILSLVRTSRE